LGDVKAMALERAMQLRKATHASLTRVQNHFDNLLEAADPCKRRALEAEHSVVDILPRVL